MARTRSISTAFWRSPAILPTSPNAKLVALYCMQGPSSTIPGVFKLSLDDAEEELALSRKAILAAIRELERAQDHDGDPFLRFDPATRTVWIVKRIAFEFPHGNLAPTQRQAIWQALDAVTPSQLIVDLCDRYASLGDPFVTVRDRVSHRLSDTVSHTLRIRLSASGSRLSASGSHYKRNARAKTLSGGTGSEGTGGSGPESEGGDATGGATIDAEDHAATTLAGRSSESTEGGRDDGAGANPDPITEGEKTVLAELNALTGGKWNVGREYGTLLRRRLTEGAKVEDLLSIVRVKAAKWGNDAEMRDNLNPETLFRPKHFQRYLEEGRRYAEAQRGGSNGNGRAAGRISGKASSVDVARSLYEIADRLDAPDPREHARAQSAHNDGGSGGTVGAGSGAVPSA